MTEVIERECEETSVHPRSAFSSGHIRGPLFESFGFFCSSRLTALGNLVDMGGSRSLWLPVPALCRGFLPPLGGASQEAAGLWNSRVSRGSLVGKGKFRRGWLQSVMLACWWVSPVTDMAGCGVLDVPKGASTHCSVGPDFRAAG